MAWFNRSNAISDAISKGDLELAMECLQQSSHNTPARELRRLTAALIDRSDAAIAAGNLVGAWKDLTHASDYAGKHEREQISKQTSQLVELTIENAETLLIQGQTIRAVQLVSQLSDRKVLDWRADRIREAANCLQQAEQLAAEGKFGEAVIQLESAKNLQPEIEHLSTRIDCKKDRQRQLKELTDQLQASALRCHWREVSQFCQQILKIAPRHEIALAAQKHSLQRMKRRTSAGSRITNVPERSSESSSLMQPNSSAAAAARSTATSPSTTSLSPGNRNATPQEQATDSFLVWVDGVGGYLVCTQPINMVGQALAGSTVSIPMQADLRKRHARIELIAGQHMVQPLGSVTVDGVTQDTAFVLKDGQILGLGAGVRLKYQQTHPLSKTSRLDFDSRHRTLPWSDGVLLASQSVIFGPHQHNHVFCPRWKSDVIFFQRNDQWFCRCDRKFRLDGQKVDGEAELRFDSQILGDDFSLTLEPVFRPPSPVERGERET